jgi:exopolysaccharide biosynthesis protein
MYNAIWGRYDLIVNGKEDIDARDGTKDNPYPRTIMGIDESGKKMFLLIADGRKPQHSRGLTMKECASLLLPYGCYQAMSCDQGGSSCMYVEKFGIVNRPGDGGERPVYTHFGLRRN